MRTAGLRHVIGAEGPFASVYYDIGEHGDLRWTAIRDQLAGAGAERALLVLADATIGHDVVAPREHAGRALVVTPGRVLVDRFLPRAPAGYVARYGDLPYLLPLVDLAEPVVPHVVVRVDPHGADLCGIDPTGRPVAVGACRPGRELDARELADVAREAATLVDRLRASLLVLSGPAEMRRGLRIALPPPYHRLVVETDEPAERVAGKPADRDEVVRRFRDESTALSGRAVHGLDDVVAALAADRVDTVLLGDALVGGRLVDGVRADEWLPLLAVEQGVDVVLAGDSLRLHEDVGALVASRAADSP
ncbi:hypothetical protein GCM10022243_17810 [Saccharothrix violaceirubra]|uniref:ERF1-like protein n=1 Tax=Saccharothrix violaceirubra TaxID=413306 RepID=A0A7W7WVD7_9PSEU|nr:hypothetical protein [Saccharothrix violaceirubra]MBB4964428.1 hypothetical protein [Saccharothrix violaceirubra]